MKNAYGYIVKHGCQEEYFSASYNFIVFADSIIDADAYINGFVKEKIEKDKHEDDFGNMVNWWWKYHEIETVKVSEFNNKSANIAWV